jgi:hypothetical protein
MNRSWWEGEAAAGQVVEPAAVVQHGVGAEPADRRHVTR